jgi:hypothetical protein
MTTHDFWDIVARDGVIAGIFPLWRESHIEDAVLRGGRVGLDL